MTRSWRRRLLRRCGVGAAAALIRLLGTSLRLNVHDPHGTLARLGPAPVIFAFWHNRILLMPYLHQQVIPQRRLKVMISRSRDGDFISAVAARFNIGAVRGSSSRGAVPALLEAARDLRQGTCDIGITPDGPRGPRHSVQEGVILLARQSGAPVIPVHYELSHKWEANSWDRFQVPLPFSRCDLVIGPQLRIEESQPDALATAITHALAHALPGDPQETPHAR